MVISPIAPAGDVNRAKKQVEFYIANSNSPYDKFMWTLYSKDPEHWIPISTIASFKRIRENTLHGSEWLVSALCSSTFLEVNSTGDKVRQTTEVKEPKDAFERSVYTNGFPEDKDATLQQCLGAFFDTYGAINSVRMQRDENKKFKASVFAEFADFKTVAQVVEVEADMVVVEVVGKAVVEEVDAVEPTAAPEGAEKTDAEASKKRKQGIEPNGGPYAGTRGTNAPPALASRNESATKKQKVDGDSS
ncbi:hypothetical protein H1R20_g1794, partial [Candolleomyces eurysporus]